MRLPLFLAMLFLFLPAAAWSQIVRGTVTDRASGAPIPGAVVSVVSHDGRRVASVLSAQDGAFAVTPPSAGRYTIRAERIGFERLTSPAVDIGAGEVRRMDLTMGAVVVSLSEMRVTGSQQCVVDPAEGTQTARLWQDVRTALTATTVTTEQQLVSARINRYQRILAPDGRVRSEESQVREGVTHTPFRSVPIEDLERHGYVRELSDGSREYFAPDAEVLLSEQFLRAHCFSVRAGHGETAGLIGLAFEPMPRAGVTEVRGVLWVERASAELRFLEFTYTGIPPQARDVNIGGRVEFARLAGGRWIVSKWILRMPEMHLVEHAAVRVLGGTPPVRRLTLTAIRESGGEILSTSDAKGAQDAPGRLEGIVFDSVAMRPLAGARVFLSGTPHSARTGENGRFVIDSVARGRYTVSFSHPRLDSLGIAGSVLAIALPDTAEEVAQLAIPAAASIIAATCEGSAPGSVLVLARVVRSGGQAAASGARVTALWDSPGGRASERADREGTVRLCGLPARSTIRIAAEEDLYGRASASVRLAPGEIHRVTLQLSR